MITMWGPLPLFEGDEVSKNSKKGGYAIFYKSAGLAKREKKSLVKRWAGGQRGRMPDFFTVWSTKLIELYFNC